MLPAWVVLTTVLVPFFSLVKGRHTITFVSSEPEANRLKEISFS